MSEVAFEKKINRALLKLNNETTNTIGPYPRKRLL